MLDYDVNACIVMYFMLCAMLIQLLQGLEVTVILIFLGVAYNKFKNKK